MRHWVNGNLMKKPKFKPLITKERFTMAISEYIGYQELYNHLFDHRLKTPDEDGFNSYIRPILTFLDCFGYNDISIKQTTKKWIDSDDRTLRKSHCEIVFHSDSQYEPLFVLDYWTNQNELRITDSNGDWDEWKA